MRDRWKWAKTCWRAAPHFLGARPTVFLYNLGVLVGIGVLAVYYFNDSDVHGLLPERLQGVPVYGVWFGALGGVAISLKGCYDHRLDWTDDWSIWHYGRVFSGALAGGVSYALLLAVNLKSGNAGQTPAAPIVASAAFILGTQEKRFFEFLVEVGRLIVTVPSSGTGAAGAPAISAVKPVSGTPGTRVTVYGSGFQRKSKAYLGGAELDNAVVNDEGTEIAGEAPDRGLLGDVNVVVSNPDNSAHMRPAGFTYEQLASEPGGALTMGDDVF